MHFFKLALSTLALSSAVLSQGTASSVSHSADGDLALAGSSASSHVVAPQDPAVQPAQDVTPPAKVDNEDDADTDLTGEELFSLLAQDLESSATPTIDWEAFLSVLEEGSDDEPGSPELVARAPAQATKTRVTLKATNAVSSPKNQLVAMLKALSVAKSGRDLEDDTPTEVELAARAGPTTKTKVASPKATNTVSNINKQVVALMAMMQSLKGPAPGKGPRRVARAPEPEAAPGSTKSPSGSGAATQAAKLAWLISQLQQMYKPAAGRGTPRPGKRAVKAPSVINKTSSAQTFLTLLNEYMRKGRTSSTTGAKAVRSAEPGNSGISQAALGTSRLLAALKAMAGGSKSAASLASGARKAGREVSETSTPGAKAARGVASQIIPGVANVQAKLAAAKLLAALQAIIATNRGSYANQRVHLAREASEIDEERTLRVRAQRYARNV